mgnify:CR=1 FL=1
MQTYGRDMIRKYTSASQKLFGLKFHERLFRRQTKNPLARRPRILRCMLLESDDMGSDDRPRRRRETQ